MPPSLTCIHCPGLKFTSESGQAKHRRTTHQKAVKTKFADGTTVVVPRTAATNMFHCPRCSACYAHPSSFKFHTEKTCTGSDGSLEATAEGGDGEASTSLTCVHCPQLAFNSQVAFNEHRMYIHVHSSQATITFGSDGVTATVQRDPQTYLFTCPRCPTGSRLITGLKVHVKTCPAPPASSTSSNTTAVVIAPPSLAPKAHCCLRCPDLVFKTSSALQWHHINVHQTATKVIFGLDGLEEAVHRDEATLKYHCPRCSFSSKASGSLKNHAKDHCIAPSQQQRTSDKASPLSPCAPHASSSSSTQASTISALVKARVFPCTHCPELAALKTKSNLIYHHEITHQRTVGVTFADGVSVVLERDVVSGAFHCSRCAKRTPAPTLMKQHGPKCPGAYGKADGSVDDAALRDLGLAYDSKYRALICVPCQEAVTLGRITVHWSTPEHEGSEVHTEAEVREALGHNAPLKPAYLDHPDPNASAHPLLELVMGWRCSACAWRGLIPDSYGHWNRKHAASLGEMPDEMTRQVKLQRWNFNYAYFEVEREADSASSSERQASRAKSGLRGERSTGPRRRAKKVRAASEASLAPSLNSDIETASDGSRESWEPGYDWEDDDESERDSDLRDQWQEAVEVAEGSDDEEWIYDDELNHDDAALREGSARSRLEVVSNSSESDWEGPSVVLELTRKSVAAARANSNASGSQESQEQAARNDALQCTFAASASALPVSSAPAQPSSSHSKRQELEDLEDAELELQSLEAKQSRSLKALGKRRRDSKSPLPHKRCVVPDLI